MGINPPRKMRDQWIDHNETRCRLGHEFVQLGNVIRDCDPVLGPVRRADEDEVNAVEIGSCRL